MADASKYKDELKALLKEYISSGKLTDKAAFIAQDFFENYLQAALDGGYPIEKAKLHFYQFLEQVLIQIKTPFIFEPYHEAITKPVNLHQFGLDFMRVLVAKGSHIKGKESLKALLGYLDKGENVVLLANHQSEADPMAIGLLLEQEYPKLSQSMIFVAGERVTTDPLAIPFSMGCNLLCIYSKRYIDFPPEDKHKKQLHNKKTMQKMSELFNQGSKCIYVAPSGGRDRKNKEGKIEVAPFDPQSIEMFYLMAKRSEKKTRFFPLSLNTYDMLPPPEGIQLELGEKRSAKYSPISISFCPEIDMEKIVEDVHMDKHSLRKVRADFIWNLVKTEFELLRGER